MVIPGNLTYLGSDNVIVGDAQTDEPRTAIAAALPNDPFIRYPHGIALHAAMDRLLVTSSVRQADLKDPGETVTVIEENSGRVLSTHKVSNNRSPSGVAPVEIALLPRSELHHPNRMGGTLWTVTWNAERNAFDFREAFDFSPHELGMPLEIYFNRDADRLYVTTAKTGHLNIFDIGADPKEPKLLTAAGAPMLRFLRRSAMPSYRTVY